MKGGKGDGNGDGDGEATDEDIIAALRRWKIEMAETFSRFNDQKADEDAMEVEFQETRPANLANLEDPRTPSRRRGSSRSRPSSRRSRPGDVAAAPAGDAAAAAGRGGRAETTERTRRRADGAAARGGGGGGGGGEIDRAGDGGGPQPAEPETQGGV